MTSSERDILLLDNRDVEEILTIKDTISALDEALGALTKASLRTGRRT